MTVDFKRISRCAASFVPAIRSSRSSYSEPAFQYVTFQFFAISVLLAMPVKLILRLALTIKYVWVTPYFNI